MKHAMHPRAIEAFEKRLETLRLELKDLRVEIAKLQDAYAKAVVNKDYRLAHSLSCDLSHATLDAFATDKLIQDHLDILNTVQR